MKNIIIIILFCNVLIFPQQNSVGLISKTDDVSDGYILLNPISLKKTYLINNNGEKVHEWNSEYNSLISYLLPNGNLVRSIFLNNENFDGVGGSTGGIEILSWNGEVIWNYDLSTPNKMLHHDIEILPNGNILAISWKKIDLERMLNLGRDPELYFNHDGNIQEELWGEEIVEINPSNSEIVWKWNVFEHVVQNFNDTLENFNSVSQNYQLIDINKGHTGDWLHFNSLDYNEHLDQILITSPFSNEIYIIDHSTTNLESSSHQGGNYEMGGDILYRWGNPLMYDMGDFDDQKLFFVHDAHWIDEEKGIIRFFNNGGGFRNFSTIETIETPLNEDGKYDIDSSGVFLPFESIIDYNEESFNTFFSAGISGSQPLSNGNILICEGVKGKIFEIDNNKNIVWEYVNPVNNSGILNYNESPSRNPLFQVRKYPLDYGVLSEKELIPYGPIESYNILSLDGDNKNNNQDIVIKNYPNPFNSSTKIDYFIKNSLNIEVSIYNILGKKIKNIHNQFLTKGSYSFNWDLKNDNGENVESGVYIFILESSDFIISHKMLLMK